MRTHLKILALLSFIVTACASREPASIGSYQEPDRSLNTQAAGRER